MNDLRCNFDLQKEPWSARAALNHGERVHLFTLIGACLLVDFGFVLAAARWLG